MRLKKYIAWAAGLLAAQALQAQTPKDTVYVFDGGEVVATRQKIFNAGTKSWEADSALLAQYRGGTLADLLNQQSGMFVRVFTPGTLATPIFRGTYGIHTAVLWNGFNLQSPMNHLLDFNLIPAFFVDDVAVGYGSHSGLYGSGAMGGTLSFGQENKADTGLHGAVTAGAGSYGLYRQGAKLTYRKGRYTGKVRYFGLNAQNNYPYKNTTLPGKPEQELTNAYLNQTGVMLENYFALGRRKNLSLNVWYQQANRGVATKMIQTRSIAYQRDNTLRITADYKVSQRRWQAIVRGAFFDERIRYTDSASQPPINNDNRAYSFITEGEWRYFATARHSINLGVNNTLVKSTAVDYGAIHPIQQRVAIFASHSYRSLNNKLSTTVTLRQEVASRGRQLDNYRLLPFIPSAGADWQFSKLFSLHGKVSRLYRLPHFNDLYWTPGGNPDLLPESGYSGEIRLGYDKKTRTTAWQLSAGGFYNNINNWILWMQSLGGIWKPFNIQRVIARGAELQGTFKYRVNTTTYLLADARYSFTISTNEKKKNAFDESYKKQLVYVPLHTAAGNITAGYKRYYLRINQQYNGYQYITADNTSFLPAFTTTNLFAGTTFKKGTTSIDINLQANNLFNATYQVVEWLPMPGRNYLVNIQFNF